MKNFIKNNYFLDRFLAFLGGICILGSLIFIFINWKISVILFLILLLSFPLRNYIKFGKLK